MADPIRLPFMRHTLSGPEGAIDVAALPCHRTERTVLSAWRLSPEELANVAKTGVVLLHVMGSTHAPIAVGILAPEENSSPTLDDLAPDGTGGESHH